MALEIGSRIGHYDVIALIGEGGMGQVYQATDTKLNRQVALKILPEAFATDPDRLARFQREAQVLASLNHPGIAAIYGIEEADDTRALVLELMEGPTLANRIAQGPIPVDEALPIAKQIAEALEAAHEQGVIHRDLKPANIKVRDDGTVKVLDFGLAKVFEPEAGSVSASMSPTISLTAAATQMGMVIGTAAYMAPEQAKGLPVDKRADIWAYGAVLFEMLTGKKLFDAGDVSEMLASVLVKDPDISRIGQHVPAHVRSVIRRCLVKDPKKRLRDIGDVRLAMEGVFETAVGTSAESVLPERTSWRQALPLALAALTVGSVATGVVVWTVTQPESPRIVRMTVSPDASPLGITAASADVAISPDGQYVAYLTGGGPFGAERIHLRSLAEFTSSTLLADGAPLGPFFSPDGEWVGFYEFEVNPNLLKRVSVRGGSALTICELPSNLQGASWGADDTIVFAAGGALWRVAATSGEPEQLATPDSDQGSYRWPEILPGGNAVLFTIWAGISEASQIAVLSLDTLEQKVIIQNGSDPSYSPTGHVVYGESGRLWAVPFDLASLEPVGDPLVVLEGVLTKDNTGAVDFSVSNNGTLIFVPGGASSAFQRRLVWVSRDGDEELVPSPPQDYRYVSLSPDGTRAALEIMDNGNVDVWVAELSRGTLTRITTDPLQDQNPLWSPDGRRVLFHSRRSGSAELLWKSADGSGEVEVVATFNAGVVNIRPYSWTPDGTTVAVAPLNQDTGPDIGLLSIDGTGDWEPLIRVKSIPS